MSPTRIKIPWAKPFLGKLEQRLVKDALLSTWISDGPYVKGFEKEFSKLHNKEFCITTSNGTSALLLSLLAIDIKPKDEVIVSGFAFMAAANMVLSLGAKVVYADIDPQTWCMDVDCIRQKISTQTKAIIVVHPYGNVCDMSLINKLAKRHKLYVIEDAAESVFSLYRKQLAGTLGSIGCFSFQATKTIAMGEGGCVLTADKKLQDKMRIIRNHGMSPKRHYWHESIGHNFRLTNIQAAIGIAQLKKLNKIIEAKKRIHALYRYYLENQKGILFQIFNKEISPVVWATGIRLDAKVFGCPREKVIEYLLKQGIETRTGFYPASTMPFYQAPVLPVAQRISKEVLILPSFPSLEKKQIKYICEHLKEIRKIR